MYCLASHYQTSPESLGEVVQIFSKQAVPLVSRQLGFKGVYLMTKSNGELMVLNIWDNEAQANAWPQNPEHQQVVAQLRPFFKGTPTRDSYEVSAYKVA
jgi:heme-degrading monooxygenase HmoA